jgi:hypothetical protein
MGLFISPFVALLTGCSLLSSPFADAPIQVLSPPAPHHDSPYNPGCLEMFDDYCDSLYGPSSPGNLVIQKQKGTPIHVLQGKTGNGLHQVAYELARSKLRKKDELPKDFANMLKSHRYFERLEKMILREPFEKMNLADRLEAHELESEVEHTWELAIRNTMILRLTRRFPEFPKVPSDMMPPEMRHYERMERRQLLSEISRVLWKHHPNWTRVVSTFEKLRGKYLALIQRLPMDDELKKSWSERIRTLSLALPGSIPEIHDQDCSSTTMNAFYYPNFHAITLCAGDFNSEDHLVTLAHEMSHALDLDSMRYQFFKNSRISRKLSALSGLQCTHPRKALSCEDWRRFKDESDDDIEQLGTFAPPLPEFNRCLKKSQGTRKLDPETIRRFAASAVRERIRELAEEEAFIRVTQPKLPLRDGKRAPNPSYLDPCLYLQSHWKNEDLDGELSYLTVFLAEHHCSTEEDPAERLKKALEFTRRLMEEVEVGMITSEGEFSERKALIEEDYSSPTSERFADVMGSLVVADTLKDLQGTWDRRMTFLAGNSWQCPGPSLSTEFPKESEVLRKYLLDSHTDGDERKMDLFSEPVRNALSCDADFDWNECRLTGSPDHSTGKK